MSLTCGVDVGGTKILGGVVDEDGTVVEELRVVSPATDVAAIEDAITGLVTELAGRHQVEAVGVGAAGYIDKSRSVVMFAPNLAWRDLDLRAELEERVRLPVVVENDANAAAWGEFRFGAGEDVDDLLLVTVGTGVGGGVVLDGRLHRGAFGVGGEIGHMRVVPGGVRCGCGNLGCLESYGSGTALVREARAAAAGGSPLVRALVDRAGGDASAITGPMVTECAQAGDPFCMEQLAVAGPLARRGHRLAGRRARPGRRGRRRRCQRGGRAVARPDPGVVRPRAHRSRPPPAGRGAPGPSRQPGRPDRRRRPGPPALREP